jgi:hypothetical protein
MPSRNRFASRSSRSSSRMIFPLEWCPGWSDFLTFVAGDVRSRSRRPRPPRGSPPRPGYDSGLERRRGMNSLPHDGSGLARLALPRGRWHSRWQFERQRGPISGQPKHCHRTLHARPNLWRMRPPSHIIKCRRSSAILPRMALLSRVFWVRLPAGSPDHFSKKGTGHHLVPKPLILREPEFTFRPAQQCAGP